MKYLRINLHVSTTSKDLDDRRRRQSIFRVDPLHHQVGEFSVDHDDQRETPRRSQPHEDSEPGGA